jgi:predicted RNase H-like HicB family nuclease
MNDYLNYFHGEIQVYRLGPISQNGWINAREIGSKIGWVAVADEHYDQFIHSRSFVVTDQNGNYTDNGREFHRPLNFKTTRLWVSHHLPQGHKEKIFTIFDLMEKDHTLWFCFHFPIVERTLYYPADKEYPIFTWLCHKDRVFVAYVPTIPGRVAEASTENEVIRKAKSAIDLWVAANPNTRPPL